MYDIFLQILLKDFVPPRDNCRDPFEDQQDPVDMNEPSNKGSVSTATMATSQNPFPQSFATSVLNNPNSLDQGL